MGNIVFRSGEEVVDADDVVTFVEKALAQMRSEKASTTSDQYSFSVMHVSKLVIRGQLLGILFPIPASFSDQTGYAHQKLLAMPADR